MQFGLKILWIRGNDTPVPGDGGGYFGQVGWSVKMVGLRR